MNGIRGPELLSESWPARQVMAFQRQFQCRWHLQVPRTASQALVIVFTQVPNWDSSLANSTDTSGPQAYLLNLSLNLSAIFEMAICIGKIYFISNRKSVISIYRNFLDFYLK